MERNCYPAGNNCNSNNTSGYNSANGPYKPNNVTVDVQGNRSIALDFIPYIGDVKGIIEGITGKDLLTKEELNILERALSLVALGEIKGISKGGKRALKSIKLLKKSDEVVMVLEDGTKIVSKKSDIVKAAVKNGDEVASGAKITIKSSKEEIQNYIVKQNIDTTKWAKDFPKSSSIKATAESSVAYHFKTHGAEVGAKSVEEYIKIAEAFSKKTGTMKNINVTLANGAPATKYIDSKSKQYIIKDMFGKIISFGSTK